METILIDPLKILVPLPKATWDMDEYNSLKDSITSQGLLHPITVLGGPEQYLLVTGETRLKIFRELLKPIPAVVIPPETSPERQREIHLHENLRRYNLPWWEQAQMRLELHELRVTMAGGDPSRGRGRVADGAKWTIRDTAEELRIALGSLSEDMQLARAVQNNPSLRKIKDRQTALQLVKQTAKRERQRADSMMESEAELNQVLCGDSLEVLKHFPADVFDACITDPPWLEFRDASLTRDESTIEVFREVYRVLKPNSFLYAIMGFTDFYTYQSDLTKMGFTVQKYPLLWAKSGTLTHGRRPWEYARDYEPILLAVKGSPVLTSPTEISSIFSIPAIPSVKLTHPNEKPAELIKKILVQCTFDNGKVLDPFAGSGVVLEASRDLGRKYLGVERDHKFYEQIKRRLA